MKIQRHLDKLINESSYSTFERTLDSMGRESYIKDECFKDRTVLVGFLRNKCSYSSSVFGNNIIDKTVERRSCYGL
jgi:hypothetical protein